MSIADRVMNKYMEGKSKNSSLGCFLAASKSFGKNSARIIVGSGSPLDTNTVRNVIFSKFNHKLIPYNDTMQTFEDRKSGMHYASIIAYRPSIAYKPADNMEGMVQVSANSFLDEEIGKVWEKQEHEGKQYFVRSNDDDLNDVLKTAMMQSSAVHVRSNTKVEDFMPAAKQEDYVEFFTLNKDGEPGKAVGKIESFNGEEMKLAVEDKHVTVPFHAVTKVVPGEKADSVEEVVEFLKKAYTGNKNKGYKDKMEKIKK